VFGADTGFILSRAPDTVRAPDIAFVAEGRFETGLPFGYVPFAPDLAVEIVSPSNTASELQAKVLEYLEAGTRLVWVIDPRRETVMVYRSRDDIRILGRDDELDAADVLPGFKLALSELFGAMGGC
jgi:Uma2 family endonuclease